MAASGTWVNPDGLRVAFGDYQKNPSNFVNVPRYHAGKGGAIKEIVIDYDLVQLVASGGTSYTTDRNNDGVVDGFNSGDTALPANASVLRVTLVVTEAAVGGTSITLGTYQKVGTAIGATSLITATEGVTANLNAIGKRVYGAGSLVAATAGTAGVGTVDAFLALVSAGTFTAGKGKIIVEYFDPAGDIA